ncbi:MULTISPECIES: hypothetical protein [unclassified Erysipelothrix]|nr:MULTISPECIES: hypothetical protein [unclassified Erysipelothrix]MBK2402141.1 hypothetical protein [Erysipelothrix sp. strain 2 (EsS2-6-Brazil)]MBK2404561.1 hypothetical protein [Erysipelothrix sp. strain 2 (EsS2-7-Brazil)]NBA01177.1 hypothetical protein [Erysipelothrix rhusiopathiae]
MKSVRKIWIPIVMVICGCVCLSFAIGIPLKNVLNDSTTILNPNDFEDVTHTFKEDVSAIRIETGIINTLTVKYVEKPEITVKGFGNLEQYRAEINHKTLTVGTIPTTCHFGKCNISNFDSLEIEIPVSYMGTIHFETIKSNIILEGLGDDAVRPISIDGMNSNITAHNLIADYKIDSMNTKITINDGGGSIRLNGLSTSAYINSIIGNLDIESDAMSAYTEFPHGTSGSYSITMNGMSNSYSNPHDSQKQSTLGTLQHHFRHGMEGFSITYESNGLSNTLVVK